MKKSIATDIEKLKNPLTFFDVNVGSSLETMEDDFWGKPTFPSGLVTTIHKIRTLPLNQLNAGYLRMAIGQKMSLPYLVPLAVERLREDPLLEGDYYEGDLLQNVLLVPDEYYHWDKASALSILPLAKKAEITLKARDNSELHEVDIEIIKLITDFVEKYSKA